MYRRKKKMNLIILLLILAVSLGIGYALISTNLTINGVGKFNNQSWNVHFEDLTYNPGNITLSQGDAPASINQTTMTDITFTVTLQEPGDFYEFEVAAVNNGTMDAMVGLVTNSLNGNPISSTNQLPAYAKYTATYSDGVAIAPNHLLEAGYSETYKVRVEYRTDIDPEDLPDEVEELSFGFGVQYVQADNNAIAKPLPIKMNFDEIENNYVGNTVSFNVNLETEGFEGNVLLTCDELEIEETASVNELGIAQFEIENIPFGNHTFEAVAIPNNPIIYDESPTISVNVFVDKNTYQIDAKGKDIRYGSNEVITVTLPGDVDENSVVYAIINGDRFDTHPIGSNGASAKAKITIDYSYFPNESVKYYYTVYWEGDSKYYPSTDTGDFTVKENPDL